METKIISARGTEDGLVLRIDGKSEWTDILSELDSFFGGRRKFFEGGQVAIEWLDRLPTVEQGKELGDILHDRYGIDVQTKRKRHTQLSLAQVSMAQPSFPTGGLPPGSLSHGNFSQSAGQSVMVEHANALMGDVSIMPGAGIASTTMSGPTISGKDASGTVNLFSKYSDDLKYSDASKYSDDSKSDGQGLSGAAGQVDSPSKRKKNSSANDYSLEGLDNLGSLHANNRATSMRHASLKSSGGFGSGLSSGLSTEIETEIASYVGNKYASRMAKMLGDDLFYEDDANAKVVFGTLRSGQRLETPFSLIIIGDVNPGADLVAGGDIIVFGSLRGTAHASAYDDDAFDRVIISLQMQPMQLRIGSVISRGSDELVRGAEIARIENRRIIVEAFNPRMLLGRKFR